MMCGIDEAIRLAREAGLPETVVNRLDYHRRQAEGVKPKWNSNYKNEYTCGNCGARVIVQDNFCPGCGFMIKWDSTRCPFCGQKLRWKNYNELVKTHERLKLKDGGKDG